VRTAWFFLHGANASTYKRLNLIGAEHQGIIKYLNCFSTVTEECEFNGGKNRAIFLGLNQSGVGTMTDCAFSGGMYQYVDIGSSMDNVMTVFFNGSNDTKMNVFCRGEGEATNGRWFGNLVAVEAGDNNLECNMGFRAIGSWSVFGGSFESASKPIFVFDSHRQFDMFAGVVYAPLTTSLVQFHARGEQPVEFWNVRQRGGFGGAALPWAPVGYEDHVIVHEFGHREQGASTFADGDTTPSIIGNEQWIADNSSPTSITTFDGYFFAAVQNPGREGWRVTVEATNGNTTIVHDTSKIVTTTGANVVLASGSFTDFVFRGGVWRMK
jgi:hypothetical protein